MNKIKLIMTVSRKGGNALLKEQAKVRITAISDAAKMWIREMSIKEKKEKELEKVRLREIKNDAKKAMHELKIQEKIKRKKEMERKKELEKVTLIAISDAAKMWMHEMKREEKKEKELVKSIEKNIKETDKLRKEVYALKHKRKENARKENEKMRGVALKHVAELFKIKKEKKERIPRCVRRFCKPKPAYMKKFNKAAVRQKK